MIYVLIIWTWFGSGPAEMDRTEVHFQSIVKCEQARNATIHQLELRAEEDKDFNYMIQECEKRETGNSKTN